MLDAHRHRSVAVRIITDFEQVAAGFSSSPFFAVSASDGSAVDKLDFEAA